MRSILKINDIVLATTDYGGPFASIVGRGKVCGLQFHPEKSQAVGLKLLRNFLSPMNIYPAIDLRNGKVVRLKYGDPNQQTTYSDDPIETARRWAEAGAAWIHVVNLDGAFGDEAGAAINRSLLQSLTAVGPQIQFGGGLRSIG